MPILTDPKDVAAYASDHRLHLALGSFDGMHLGHQAILRRAVELAGQNQGTPGVLLLEPHPAKVLGNGAELRMLCDLEEKTQWISRLGGTCDIPVFVLPFDKTFASVTPESFARDYLKGMLQITAAVCGFNYQFGQRGEGGRDALQQYAGEYGFSCSIVSPVTHQGEVVSSTWIRDRIEEGAMYAAYACLGHCHVFSGEVVKGRQVGGQIGFPTANLRLAPDAIWPAYGVYGCFVRDEQGGVFRGIANAGVRPTVNQDVSAPSFEVHILEYEGNLYGKRLQAVLTDRIRPEAPFTGLEALQGQIREDVETAVSLLDKWLALLLGKGLGAQELFTCFIRDYPI